MSKFKAKEKTY